MENEREADCASALNPPHPARQDLETADHFVFVVDRDLLVQYADNREGHLLCRTGPVIGRKLSRLFLPDVFRVLEPRLVAALETGRHSSHEDRIVLNDREHLIETSLAPIAGGNGITCTIVGVARDVTERRTYERLVAHSKEEWLRAIDSMPHLMAISDTRFRIRKVNQAMADRLGVTVQAAVGLTCHEHLRGLPEPPYFCPLLRAASGRKERKLEFIERCDDEVQLVTVRSLRDRYGELVGCLYMVCVSSGLQSREGELPGKDRETMGLLLRRADHIITIQNKEGRYVFVSSVPPCSLLTRNLPGKTPFDFFDTAMAVKMLERVRQVAESGLELSEETHVSGDGEKPLCFFDRVSPIRDSAGHIRAVVTISKRISGRSRHLEENNGCLNIQGLTARETEVLRLIASGLTNKQIAEKLYISRKTVETHRARIMQKLDLHKSSALVRYALTCGII
ncbi:MAG: PAS domain-containing protein [Deltaproteobacteria bacterium]|nr:PAS domain-containing protein [Deltaproteobacteria bacterium]